MNQMRVKDLIAALQSVDPELPIYKGGNSGGEYVAVDNDYAGYWLTKMDLMTHKTNRTYCGSADDPIWEKFKHNFKKPFKAVVFK